MIMIYAVNVYDIYHVIFGNESLFDHKKFFLFIIFNYHLIIVIPHVHGNTLEWILCRK